MELALAVTTAASKALSLSKSSSLESLSDLETAELEYELWIQRGYVSIGRDTLKRVVWYFEEGGMVLCKWWYGTLKRVVWCFEEGDMSLHMRLFNECAYFTYYFWFM